MTPSSATDSIKLAMASTNQLFHTEVFGKRNLDALDDIYTKDARILPPGAPMIAGRDAIKAFWGSAIEAMNATAVSLTSVDVILAGDGMVEIGKATLTAAPQGQPSAQMEVKYVVYWQQEDDRWKWRLEIWNVTD